MATEKRSLLFKLNFMVTRLEQDIEFIDEFQDNASSENIVEAENRYESLTSFLHEFTDKYLNYLESPTITDEEVAEVEAIYKKFSKDYYDTKSKFQKTINAHKIKPIPSKPVNETKEKPKLRVKLPEFELPKFDGKIESWPAFRDSFDALIHRTDLPTIEKFYYLISCCKGGEAENILDLFQVTTNNYANACQALSDRYDDTKLLVDKHLSELLRCKSITKGNPEELKNLLNCYSVHIKQLTQQVPNEKTLWNLMIVNMVSWS